MPSLECETYTYRPLLGLGQVTGARGAISQPQGQEVGPLAMPRIQPCPSMGTGGCQSTTDSAVVLVEVVTSVSVVLLKQDLTKQIATLHKDVPPASNVETQQHPRRPAYEFGCDVLRGTVKDAHPMLFFPLHSSHTTYSYKCRRTARIEACVCPVGWSGRPCTGARAHGSQSARQQQSCPRTSADEGSGHPRASTRGWTVVNASSVGNAALLVGGGTC